MSMSETMQSMERGRLMAAKVIANDNEKRKELEQRYGVDVIRNQYPEAYRKTSETQFGRLLDRIRMMW